MAMARVTGIPDHQNSATNKIMRYTSTDIQ